MCVCVWHPLFICFFFFFSRLLSLCIPTNPTIHRSYLVRSLAILLLVYGFSVHLCIKSHIESVYDFMSTAKCTERSSWFIQVITYLVMVGAGECLRKSKHHQMCRIFFLVSETGHKNPSSFIYNQSQGSFFFKKKIIIPFSYTEILLEDHK